MQERVIRPGVTELSQIEPLRRARRATAVLSVCGLILVSVAGAGALLFVRSAAPTSGAEPVSAKATPAGQPSLLPRTALPVGPTGERTSSVDQQVEPRMTVGAMTGLVRVYLLRAAGDSVSGYDLFSAAGRRSVGGLSGYRTFWDDITFATPSHLVSYPGSGRVTFDVRYRHNDRHHTYGHTTMWLVRSVRGGYRVAAEQR